jgi:membrane protein required for colicin V production
MLEAQLNIFDVIVIFVLGFSALVSFFRGFLREVFSLGAWLGAGIITLYAYPSVAAMLSAQISNTLVANGLASMGTFMVSLITISMFGALMLKYLKPGTEIGVIDNTLGLIFGLLRGVLLVAIGFYVMSLFMRPEDYPDWVSNAKTLPHVERVAGWIASIAPTYLSDISPTPDDAPLADSLPSADILPERLPEATAPEVAPAPDNAPTDAPETTPFWPTMEELQNTINGQDDHDTF